MPEMSLQPENLSGYRPSTLKSQGQISVDTENMNYKTQMAKYPVVPLLDRPHPVLDWVKERAPIVPRVKLIGAFGVVDPSEGDYSGQRFGAGGAGGQFSRERIIPKPYPSQRFVWGKDKPIARLPSVIVGSHPTPAERQLHPQGTRDIRRKAVAGRIQVQI